MKLTIEDIKIAIDWITRDIPLLYDISITTPPIELVQQRAQDNFNIGKPECLNQKYMITDKCKSVIVWNVFSNVAYDYTYKNVFVPQIITYLNLRYNSDGISFGYDDYILNRKQFAIRSGSATLAKTSLAFHKKFGMNYKIDLIFTDAEFEEVVEIEEERHYSNCIGCPAPCEKNCPQSCKMNFDLVDWEKCANFVDVPESFKDLDNICRICQESCPYSEELKNRILQLNPKYGVRLNG